MPTSTKPAQPQASKPAKEATEEEPVQELKSQLGLDPTLEKSEGPQPPSKEVSDIRTSARLILTENLDVAH